MRTLLRFLFLILTLGMGYKLLRYWKQRQVRNDFVNHSIAGGGHAFTDRSIRRSRYSDWQDFFSQKKGFLLVGLAIMVLLLESSFLKDYSYLFRASLVEFKPIQFTGTVSPMEKVPDWYSLSEAERNLRFDQLDPSKLIDPPVYNPTDFVRGKKWETASQKERNAYIYYSVPYLGNYEIDGSEYTGSHPGVDMTALIGTPIVSIANGVVYKTEKSNVGFGNYITVIHVGMPDPDDPSKKTTLYSTYAHLSEILVSVGDEVNKGQVIGKSGDTGLSTAPHLHFQIDREGAPFYAFWPFVWSDVQAAGLHSHFDAVRYGVGKKKALQYTVHPMHIVDQFRDYVSPNLVTSSDETVVAEVNEKQDKEEISAETQPNVSSDDELLVSAEEVVSSPLEVEHNHTHTSKSDTSFTSGRDLKKKDIVFESVRTYVPGEPQTVRLQIDEANLIASATIHLDSTLRELATVQPSAVRTDDLVDGMAEIQVQTELDRMFKLVATGDFGEVKSQSLRPQVFKDVLPTHANALAITYLKREGIVNGYPDGTFRPDENLNRAEAVKILLIGNDLSVEAGVSHAFSDVVEGAWFRDFVATAAKRGIVKGYADGSFKPDNKISRAEFLKVSILTAGFEVSPELENDPYMDVEKDAWFAPYFAFGKDHRLITPQRGGYAVPSQQISRAEAAEIMYRLSNIQQR